MFRAYFDRFLWTGGASVVIACIALVVSLPGQRPVSLPTGAEELADRGVVSLLYDHQSSGHIVIESLTALPPLSISPAQKITSDSKTTTKPPKNKELIRNEDKKTQQAELPAGDLKIGLLSPPLLAENARVPEGKVSATDGTLLTPIQSMSLADSIKPGIVASVAEAKPLIEEAPPSVQVPAREPIVGVAERIEVPSISIDLPVKTGAYDVATGSWAVDDSSAFHADTTVPVNDTNGATLIYGHAKWGVFGNLPDIQPGAEATVYAAGGKRFVYTLDAVQQVDPGDVSMLTVDGDPKLILQTCSGLLDQHRTLAIFHLKEII